MDRAEASRMQRIAESTVTMRLRSGRAPAVILHGRKYWIGDGICPDRRAEAAGRVHRLPGAPGSRDPPVVPAGPPGDGQLFDAHRQIGQAVAQEAPSLPLLPPA